MASGLSGYLFACSNTTEAECFNRGLFGGRTSLGRLDEIAPGLPLLLYNVQSKELSGPYAAASYEGEHQPDAWGGSFPCQVLVERSPGWKTNAQTVTVPRGTRGLNSGPLNQDRYERLLALLAGEDEEVIRMKMFHGTSVENAQRIEAYGFDPSPAGCLGPGVYLARQEKAEKFALHEDRHGGAGGCAVLECLVRVQRPKYVGGDDRVGTWRSEGFDACRAEFTSASTNMEWCIGDPSQIEVLRWYEVDDHGRVDDGSEGFEEYQASKRTRY